MFYTYKKLLIKKLNLQLLPIDQVDVSLLQKWQNDNRVKYPLMSFRFPIQKKSVHDWLDNIRKSNGKERVVYGIFVNEKPLGMISLDNIDYVNRKASYGIYVAENKNNNKGIGFKATHLLLDFAFNAMDLNRIELDVLINNKNAIHLYKKIGFVNEGLKRDSFFADGKFIDVQVMAILKKEFKFEKKFIDDRLVISYSN